MAICDQLKKVRNDHGLKQHEVAVLLGIDRSTYAFYETGKTYPSPESIIKLADAYNVTVGYLLGVEENNPSFKTKGVEVGTVVDAMALLSERERMLLMFYRLANKDVQARIFEELMPSHRQNKPRKNAKKDSDG